MNYVKSLEVDKLCKKLTKKIKEFYGKVNRRKN